MQAKSKPAGSGKRSIFTVTPGIIGIKMIFVNAYLVRANEHSNAWVLVDAGLKGYGGKIKKVAQHYFGEGTKPEAILLTHGHFDHVGALLDLAHEWNVPIFAHPMEMPYVTGQSKYPPPDPTVGGGGMAYMAWAYPRGPVDASKYIKPLPVDGSVPGLSGWRWIHTPGHTAGHVSFFRESDRALIAGDAFVTRHAESAMAVITQKREVHGPPAYFTSDWRAAQWSVQDLANLQPHIAATGHGMPMRGQKLQEELEYLSKHFGKMAVPSRGRYVPKPAVTDEHGVVSVPPPVISRTEKVLLSVGLTTLAVAALLALFRYNNRYEHK
jgi:glyoxylase-like metal-dependent hydrolase (beta-lactamase superfamily II)